MVEEFEFRDVGFEDIMGNKQKFLISSYIFRSVVWKRGVSLKEICEFYEHR